MFALGDTNPENVEVETVGTMYRELFRLDHSGDRSRKRDRFLEQLWVFILLLAALALLTMNLGSLPLRDWDEGTVAQVARDIWRSDLNWLYPTKAGEVYLNKPPLVHLLIAWAYQIGGVNEWTTRLPSAMLTAFSVPLLYGIGREIFPWRTPAIFSALVYLTLLPVIRHGRLAMLDGPVVCFFLLMIWCLVRSRRDLRYGLGVGIGFGLICFTKGILGLLLAAIAATFVIWDTPRLFTSWYLWSGLFLGSAPVLSWYLLQGWQYGQQYFQTGLMTQSFSRVWHSVEGNKGPIWYYLLELAKYSWPWILFWPQAARLTWENRKLSWAKLVIVWVGIYLLVISVMNTKLPWYVFPLYPAFSLATGALMAEFWHGPLGYQGPGKKSSTTILTAEHPSASIYTRRWVALFSVLSFLAWGGCIYYSGFDPAIASWDIPITLATFAMTLSVVAFLIAKRDSQFILVLFWGTYVSLMAFVNSGHWNWELGEEYPVKPVAEMIQQSTPPSQVILTSHPHERPSLNFYSDRKILPADLPTLQQHWQQDPHPYLLVQQSTLKNLNLDRVKVLDTAVGWVLITPKEKN